MTLHHDTTHSRSGSAVSSPLLQLKTWRCRLWHKFLTPLFSGIRHGHIEFLLPAGGRLKYGQGTEQEPIVHVQFHSHQTLWKIVSRGMLGVAESFMAAHWSCDNLAALFDLCLKNRQIFDALRTRGNIARKLAHLRHLKRANSLAGSRRNISYHYDLGNAFYALWLDPTMTYSSAYKLADAERLETGQIRKLDRALELSGARADDHILEIGCGWGAFAERAALAGCQTDGLTLSQEQLDYSLNRAHQGGFSDRARFHLRDYRHETGKYDAIVSIEMIEAVGEEHWETYFQCLHDSLRPGGRAVIQAITIEPESYNDYRNGADFIQTYIFPGGMLPTPAHLDERAKAAGLTPVHRETFASDYAETLARWRQSFLTQWPKIAKLGYDERFRRMWLFYLAYCEAGFGNGTIDVGHYGYERPA